MKKYSIILLIFVLAACGKNESSSDNADVKLQEYKTQVAELNKKISELQNVANSDNSISGEALKISVIDISESKFEHYFTSTASLEAVESAFISPEMSGQVKQIHIAEGSFVKKGQLLISLNSSILKSSLNELETALALAELVFKKQSELWDKKIGSEMQYLEAKNQKESLENKIASLKEQIEMTKIKAPVSGIIDAIRIKVGEMAMPGQPIVTLINLDKMYVNANVSESYIASLAKGDKVTITFPTYPDVNLESTIFRVGNVIDEGNRTIKIQVLINNINKKFKPNMVAQVKLKDYQNNNAILIPSIIVRNDLEGSYVFVVEKQNGKNVAAKRYIKTGKSNNENTIIIEGLKVGEKVISEGYNLVKNGTFVDFN